MHQKSIVILRFILILWFFSSCNSSKKEENLPAAGIVNNLSAHARLSDGTAGDINTPPVNKKRTGDNPSVEKNSNSPALNPQHGQPGHRCDLQVGAPLPITKSVKPSEEATSKPIATPSTKVASTKKNLNPAHGQPGHRCDLQVGAPLPANGPTKQAVAITNSQGATAKPGDANPTVNPAHGQPGHRCDLAVGAPLNNQVPK